MRPLAWRARHDAFTSAARALRTASPTGPAPDAVASLTTAHRRHARYEEDVLWPRYAEVAPEDGPGSLRALRRDHALLESHLAHAADTDPLVRAWCLARLEHVLDHHDQREATHVLPALEALGVDVDLDEPPIVHAPPASLPRLEPTQAPDWPTALHSLATGRPCLLPALPEGHRKVLPLRDAYEASLARGALVEAFDRALELAWCSGQARADWALALRSLSAPTRPR